MLSKNVDILVLACTPDKRLGVNWRIAAMTNGFSCQIVQSPQLEQILADHAPSIVLYHLSSAETKAGNPLQHLHRDFPSARFIVMTDIPSNCEGIETLRHGAYGYCNAHISGHLLQRVLTTVANGEVWVGWKLMQNLLKQLETTEPAQDPQPEGIFASLTEREWQIVQMVADGENNKHIATKLDISERTVKHHLTTIFRKTGTKDRLNLALELKKNSVLTH
jgi:two-component system nitrate/nitrite response regulator NarL